jgi:hypothetical protein
LEDRLKATVQQQFTGLKKAKDHSLGMEWSFWITDLLLFLYPLL